jgi:starch phosphorylase
MSNRTYTNRPSETESSDALAALALDLRWTWNHSADELWGRLDRELWELTRNPWVVLQAVSPEKLQEAWGDPAFRKEVDEILQETCAEDEAAAWFHRAHPQSPLTLVAYFSMEYMLSEALPVYSGGLGNVAGDQLKAASDLGVPVVAVGLLYQQGYFRQVIDAHGAQHALYPFNDPAQLPIRPLRRPNGGWVRLTIALPGLKVWVRAWQAQVGRARLYLLDSNDPANPPEHRAITGELYGGGPELRLQQEIVLGIGGWRLLRALGLRPEVCHLNEGHAAFAVLERARAFMSDNRKPFEAALAVTRAGNVFTTHTAVEAAFDRFSSSLMEKYFRRYATEGLGIPFEDLMALGRRDRRDGSQDFGMAYLAMRGSCSVNGVSRLHGDVSRALFQGFFPRWPRKEVPVGHVTNGVHTPTWESRETGTLWSKTCGDARWLGDMDNAEPLLGQADDSSLWRCRAEARRALVQSMRRRLARQRAEQGTPVHEVAEAERMFDFDTLTLGFARRFAPYKRPNLLLLDPERLVRILTDPKRPVQLILAGKAHPQDAGGQALIERWNEFIRRADLRGHVVFLADYDMLLTQELVQGVDVWVNTPRRPWEACGTSGMKVLVNGGLNLSELDGWWAEAYSPAVGWAIGDQQEHGDDPEWDRAEADMLYTLLEREVVPAFYTRDDAGVPTGWVAKMRASMASLTPMYSANRAVREYTNEHYLPAAVAFAERAADGGRLGTELVAWQQALAAHWDQIRFGAVTIETRGAGHAFDVQVFLDELDPEFVRIELYADAADGDHPFCEPATRSRALEGSAGGYVYRATVPATRAAAAYTPRIVPFKTGAIVPLEANQILWQR